ncbi:MAG TPA: enoyl-CoA hydratase/isomerase family protein [Anaeromyxobacteraceae bacterium]|nr:enoyl-CoA hydratase/isomerase family protein [Anaeromyxobacteraceae bacterium]
MAYEFLKVDAVDRVGWLEYRRPPVNAVDWTMLREIPVALDELLGRGDVRVVVIASALEKFFSTGADLKVLQAMKPEDMRTWVETCHGVVRKIRQARKPIIGAIHGTAVGAGLEMVLNCDLRFAAATARLGQPEINIGFIPPVGTTQSLSRLLGRSRALRFLYEGTLVAAEEALAMGLVDFVVAPEKLRGEVQAYAAALAGKPAGALAAIRRCIIQGSDLPYDEALAIEVEEAVRLAGTPDFAEGLRAFLEKRTPKWQ